mmetsp:Transcript_50488/g.50859  ORF Transcript_50488/g.50859 Transcript_50488/m.50859 type:complete len:82 (-) Transcript_50488:158-403(-)
MLCLCLTSGETKRSARLLLYVLLNAQTKLGLKNVQFRVMKELNFQLPKPRRSAEKIKGVEQRSQKKKTENTESTYEMSHNL